MKKLHYFLSSNSSKGYVTFFDSNFKKLKKVVKLNCYPRTLLNDISQKIISLAEEKNYDIQIIHSCLDNSVEGVIIPQLKSGMISNPPYSPETDKVVNEQIAMTKKTVKKAYEHFSKALKIHDEWEKIYIKNIDFNTLDNLTNDTINKLIGNKKLEKEALRFDRFFGAATVNGAIDYIENITEELKKRYFIKGRPGSGKSTLMKKIAQHALDNGFDVEVYHCAFDPDSLDLVTIRELDLCIFDSTAPHEYFPSKPSDEIIDIYDLAIKDGTDEKYKKQLAEIQNAYSEQIKAATEILKQAKSYYDKAEDDYLSEISREKIENSENRILQELGL